MTRFSFPPLFPTSQCVECATLIGMIFMFMMDIMNRRANCFCYARDIMLDQIRLAWCDWCTINANVRNRIEWTYMHIHKNSRIVQEQFQKAYTLVLVERGSQNPTYAFGRKIFYFPFLGPSSQRLHQKPFLKFFPRRWTQRLRIFEILQRSPTWIFK